MDRPLPATHPGYPMSPGVVARQWPAKYLTPRVIHGVELFGLHKLGLRLLDAPVLLWPGPLVEVIQVLTSEYAIREANRV